MAVSLLRRLDLGEGDMRDLCSEILEIPSLRGLEWETTSSEVIEEAMRKVNRVLQDPDPFASEKARQNKIVLDLVPQLRSIIDGSANPLYTATQLSIIGNAIDFMVPQNTADIRKSILERLEFPLDRGEYETFEERLRKSRRILMFADNCGEVVLDMLFMEAVKRAIPMEFVVVVKSEPVMNDATMKEALAVGLDRIATVVENGIRGPLPGTILARCSEQVREWASRSDLVVSKGGGNFDTLDEQKDDLPRPIAFMLLSKCRPYFDAFGVEVHRPVLCNHPGGR
jgi:uncharacterized protein with ATP-grasp and redox domains